MRFDKWARNGAGIFIPLQRPVAIDLFCGAGGFSLGFMKADWHVIAGLDNDPAAMMTYLYNLGAYPVQIHFATEEDAERLEKYMRRYFKRAEQMIFSGQGWVKNETAWPVYHFFFGDARKWTGEDILSAIGLERGQVDAVIGGPPCQGFSKAGKRNVMDMRNSLVFEFARLVCEIAPMTLCMENVPDMATMVTPEGINVVDALYVILESGGFGAYDDLRRQVAESGPGQVIQGNRGEVQKQLAFWDEPDQAAK